MGKCKLALMGMLYAISPCFLLAQSEFSYNPNSDSTLTITNAAPPAIIWLTDSMGRRTGADPNVVVNGFGQQGPNLFEGPLNEIPDSRSEQTNLGNDQTGQRNPTTFWECDVVSPNRQTYTINLQGVSVGDQRINICGLFPSAGEINRKMVVMVEPGTSRRLTVMFDPGRRKVEVTRLVAPGDLSEDVNVACRRDYIEDRDCDRLKDRTNAIKLAIERHECSRARELLVEFLDIINGEKSGDHHDRNDRNKRDSIKEPALSILMDEAQVLLSGLQASADHEGRHGHDHDDHNR